MNIHEYQSKAILKSFGAPVSEGQPALTVKEAVAAAKILPGPVYVVNPKSMRAAAAKANSRNCLAMRKEVCGLPNPSTKWPHTPGKCSATRL